VQVSYLQLFWWVQAESGQVKSMMLTDAGSNEPLGPYHSWNTTTTFQ